MPVRTAALIVALRPVLEALIVRVTTNPECLASLSSPRELNLIEVVQALAAPGAVVLPGHHRVPSVTHGNR